MPKRRSLLRKGAAQFGGQFLGLLLALLVSHLIARRMGIGPEADAFLLGRRLITSVSEMLNQVLVVVFIPFIAAQAAARAGLGRIVVRSVGPGLLLGFALAAAFVFAAPQIVAAIAPSFPDPTKDLAVTVVVLLSAALPALVATVALSAYCNVHGVFGPPAVIRQGPRAGVALALALATSGAAAVTASTAYTIAAWAVIGVALLISMTAHRGPSDLAVHVDTETKPGPGGRELTRRSLAAIILAVGALATLWLETSVAARQGLGGLAMLDFGQRLGALLGNTLATALGLVVFADLSRRAAQGEVDTLGPAFFRSTLIGLALAVPITIGLIVNAEALVELLLSYGAFATSGGRAQVVLLMQIMAAAPLGALVLRMMLARILVQDDLPVVRLVGGAMLIDMLGRIALFALLVPPLGLVGIPLALVLAPAAPAAFLLWWLRGRGTFASGTRSELRAAAGPVWAGSVLTAGAIAAGALLVPETGGKAGAAVQVAVSGGAGAIVLAVSAVLLRLRFKLT